MIKANVYNISGEKVKELDLNPAVFGLKVKPELVSQAIITQQANSRQVTAHTKGRGEVAGGGRKPWRQKGTGRARVGSIRSPLWRGGGITFGPTKDRNFSLKINKKAKRKAILMSLSDKAANEKIVLLDSLELNQAKTKKFFEILKNLKLREKSGNKLKKSADKVSQSKDKTGVSKSKDKSVLLVLAKKDEKVQWAAKNIPRLTVIYANSLNVLEIVKNQYLLMPVDSIVEIEKTFISTAAKALADKK